MCTRPQTFYSEAAGGEVTVACGSCDACVAVRIHNWVARGLAEKSCHPQTIAVTLTYDDETEFNRDGSRFFRYSDIRQFLARIRRQIAYHTGEAGKLRFICAGEQGSRTGRCHWHIILFADVDLMTVGEFKAAWGVVTGRDEIVSGVKKAKRLMWSMWPHGFCVVQEPDQAGFHYALSYALKDQFSTAKSEGSSRISRSEQFATGKFNMSKTPPIGAEWVDQRIYWHYERGVVDPTLKLQVPNFRGYWVPSGLMRKRYLEGMRRVNASFMAQHGRTCGQWSSLVQKCSENEGDLDALGLNQEEENETSIQTQISLRAREADATDKARQIIRQCGADLACDLCLRGFGDETLKRLGLAWTETDHGPQIVEIATGTPPERYHRAWGINPLCQLRETAGRKRVFLQSARDK